MVVVEAVAQMKTPYWFGVAVAAVEAGTVSVSAVDRNSEAVEGAVTIQFEMVRSEVGGSMY